ncbi:MAG: hypothetical protein LBT04_01220 [Prevotellaceae bacterium]|nr:hypothetical protein [Prevotellaceae bacterium]
MFLEDVDVSYTADGVTINTRKKDKNDSTWRENKPAVVFSSDNMRLRKDGVTHDLLKKEYVQALARSACAAYLRKPSPCPSGLRKRAVYGRMMSKKPYKAFLLSGFTYYIKLHP